MVARNLDPSHEASVRRTILNIYNKPKENFGSTREYDDYLEEIEDISTCLGYDLIDRNTSNSSIL